MRIQKTILDNYLTNKQKIFACYLLIMLFFGFLYIFRRPLFLKDLTIGLSCLIGLIVFTPCVFSKKILMNIDGKIFKGLIFNDFIIYKKQIKTEKIKSFNIYKNRHQTSAPLWTGPLMDSFIREHLYELRTESISGKEKYLIRFNEQKFFESGIDFFKKNMDVEIKNCG